LPRRADADRRHRDRRSAASTFRSERRGGPDRRKAGRRVMPDRRMQLSRRRGRRRRETALPYTIEHMDLLRTRFASPGPVYCPACGGAFTLGPARRRGNEIARRVVCLGCGRAAVVPNSRAARIILIDQNAAVREHMAVMLAGAGHEVIEAGDASVGLAAYETVPADVVFLDVLGAGRLDPTDFVRRLRRRYPDARVVAMAGRPTYGGVDLLAVMQGLGAVRTLRMPVTRDKILQTVEEARP
jgi:CheY-like chemotaxis protein